MTLLNDTHVLLWLASDDPRAAARVRATLTEGSERHIRSFEDVRSIWP